MAETRRFRGEAPSDDDIFAFLKLNLCDDDLSQPPLLVWPASSASASREALATARGQRGFRNAIDHERAEGLRRLAEALRNYPQYERGAAYLEQVAGVRNRPLVGLHAVDFLAGARHQRRQLMPPGAMAAQPARPEAYRLHAVFGRGRR